MNISLEILYNLTSIFYKGKIVIEKINEKQNILNDNIGFVENWDFSKANLNEENRILAITQVASICYQNPKALGSESLYNRLMAESMGLPSSSFEFVPVLLDYENPKHQEILKLEYSNCKKFGEILDDRYLLTNYRALVYDFENDKDKFSFDIRTIFNTQEECKIIKEHFKVFLFKVDLPTRSQMVRHRVSWQELSRRYVSGSRVPFEFYVSEKMKDVYIFDEGVSVKGSKVKICFTAQDIIDISLKFYKQALEVAKYFKKQTPEKLLKSDRELLDKIYRKFVSFDAEYFNDKLGSPYLCMITLLDYLVNEKNDLIFKSKFGHWNFKQIDNELCKSESLKGVYFDSTRYLQKVKDMLGIEDEIIKEEKWKNVRLRDGIKIQ